MECQPGFFFRTFLDTCATLVTSEAFVASSGNLGGFLVGWKSSSFCQGMEMIILIYLVSGLLFF